MNSLVDENGSIKSKLFIAYFILVYFALSMALLTPPMVTIALRVAQVAPEHKEHVLSLLLGIGAVFAIVGNPLAGYFSDRTVSKFGKRKLWMVGGALLGFMGLWLIAIGDVPTMIVGWCVTQLGFNAVAAAVTALLPDQVPERLRGSVSGAMGMSLPAGMIAGFTIANLTSGNQYMMFLVPPAILLFLIFLLCSSYTDKETDTSALSPFSLKQLFKDFYFNPKEMPDFSWAFLSRFMLFMAIATFYGYQVYFLMDRLGYSQAEVLSVMVKVTVITSGVQIFSSFVSGWLSDYFKRRKIFVWASAAVYALGLVMISYAYTLDAFLLGACIMSFSFGVYFAVDMALVTDVLPDSKHNAAKDLGIMNVAGALPGSLAPALAPLVLFAGSQSTANYNYLFAAAAVFAVFGALTIIPIKKVR
jgi:MFS family permease